MSKSVITARPRLSVAILVRDAAERLAATLTSIQGLADEIVVADTGSTDATLEVARCHGAKIVALPWVDDFSQSRNAALTQVSGQWVLWLDAGETLTTTAAAELRQFIEHRADVNKAYMLLVVVPPAAEEIDGEQAGRIRLLPNRADLRFAGRVRETLRPAIELAGLTVEGLQWRISRDMQEHDPQLKLAKARRNLRLLGLEIKQHGHQPHLLVALGDALANMGDHTLASTSYQQAKQMAAPNSTILREACYGHLTVCDAAPALHAERLSICVEALAAFPLDTQLLCAMGGYVQAEGRLDLAARSYETALQYGQVDPETWHLPDIDGIAAVCLSMTHQMRGNDDEATRVLVRALETNPLSTRVRRQLIDLHIKHDRRQEALAELDQLEDMPDREALRTAIRGACLAARQSWGQALSYLQAAYDAGCRDVVCLRWLSVALVSAGEFAAAVPVVDQWLAIEPRSSEAQQCHAAALAASDHTGVAQGAEVRRRRIDIGRAPLSGGPAAALWTDKPAWAQRR